MATITKMKPAAWDIFEVGQKVNVGANYSEKHGTIVGFHDDYPFHVNIQLDHENGMSTTCMIKLEHLSGHSTKLTAKDRFRIGQFVRINGSYSEKYGIVKGFSDSFPYKVDIRMDHMNGGFTECMIDISKLS